MPIKTKERERKRKKNSFAYKCRTEPTIYFQKSKIYIYSFFLNIRTISDRFIFQFFFFLLLFDIRCIFWFNELLLANSLRNTHKVTNIFEAQICNRFEYIFDNYNRRVKAKYALLIEIKKSKLKWNIYSITYTNIYMCIYLVLMKYELNFFYCLLFFHYFSYNNRKVIFDCKLINISLR